MADDASIVADRVSAETKHTIIMAGKLTLMLAAASIRTIRVLIVIMMARHTRKKELERFVGKHGANLSFLQIGTENPESLRQFEKTLQKGKIGYSRLPDLQKDDQKTQYLYDLDDLGKLDKLLHEYSKQKLKKLDVLKEKDLPPANYDLEKEKLDSEMPGITLITAEDYAQTSIKQGYDTAEFKDMEASTEQEMKKAGRNQTPDQDEKVREFFRDSETVKDNRAMGRDAQTRQKKYDPDEKVESKRLIRRRSR